MKFYIVCWALVTFLTPSIAQNISIEYYADGGVKAKGKRGLNGRDSLWTFYYPDGKTSATLYYRDNLLNGKAFFWDFEGKLQAVEQWKNDLQEDSAWYYESGHLHKCGILQQGVYEGVWQFYGATGKFIRKGSYRKGLPHGAWTFWDKDGQLWQQGEFWEGKEHGVWQFYSEKGKLESEGKYENGVAVGIWKYYNKKGKLVREGAPPAQ